MKKNFDQNRIDWVPAFESTRKSKGPINCSLEYYHPSCGWFCNPYELMSRIKYEGVEYRRSAEFNRYYFSSTGNIISLASGIRKLTPQYIKNSSGVSYGPVARLRKTNGVYHTRSVAKLVKELWD